MIDSYHVDHMTAINESTIMASYCNNVLALVAYVHIYIIILTYLAHVDHQVN